MYYYQYLLQKTFRRNLEMQSRPIKDQMSDTSTTTLPTSLQILVNHPGYSLSCAPLTRRALSTTLDLLPWAWDILLVGVEVTIRHIICMLDLCSMISQTIHSLVSKGKDKFKFLIFLRHFNIAQIISRCVRLFGRKNTYISITS